ncbi:MAG: alanine/glycine:cation symporter family protein [Fusobacteriaceae bacterium]
MSSFDLMVQNTSDIIWNSVLIFLLLGTGIFYTIKLKFIQIRKFKEGFKRVISGATLTGEAAGAEGMSSYQSLATAIAAQVGTGNLAGAATAIAAGGPGAIFWMWLSAFFGMATVYSEAVLGQLFKRKVGGEMTGGPAYYISEGLGNTKFSKILAGSFSVSCVLALAFMGNAVQSNSIAVAFKNVLPVSTILIGGIIAILAGFIFIGGIKRIASFAEKVVPVMAGLYVVASILIVLYNFQNIFPALKMIVVGAFSPTAMLGGALGVTIKQAVRFGVARGIFSNEAGMGSTPHAHAVAKVKHPAQQGAVAIITVFIDTFVVLTCTALVIIMNVDLVKAKEIKLTGIELTQFAFVSALGKHGGMFIAICLLFFAFSTIIGWYYFGETNVKYLVGVKGLTPYRLIVLLFIFLGSMAKVEVIWNLADLFNGLMAFPNLIALLLLYKLVDKSTTEYETLKEN